MLNVFLITTFLLLFQWSISEFLKFSIVSSWILPHLDSLLRLDKYVLTENFDANHPKWNSSPRSDSVGTDLFNYCLNNVIEVSAPPSFTRFCLLRIGTTIDFALLVNVPFPYSIISHSVINSHHLLIQLNLVCSSCSPSLQSAYIYDWDTKTIADVPSPIPRN